MIDLCIELFILIHEESQRNVSFAGRAGPSRQR